MRETLEEMVSKNEGNVSRCIIVMPIPGVVIAHNSGLFTRTWQKNIH